jgi:predicted metal-dependent phosphoesterase TrpH
MRRIDLHAHTDRSDGSLRPADLVRLAAEIGLAALAVTDHDTTSGLAEARAAGATYGVQVLTGAEITARFPARAMHLLAYGFDEREPRLQAMLAEIVGYRDVRNPRIVDRLAALGCRISMDDVRAEAAGDVIARPHIARALVRRGLVPDTKTSFQQYLRDGGPAYIPAESVTPEEVIAAVRAAGGIAVVAHPRQLRVESADGYRALFAALAASGLGGIEVLHPSHHAEDRALYADVAATLDLVPTGGSDFHGTTKPDIRLGVGDGSIEIAMETWEALRARCDARPA